MSELSLSVVLALIDKATGPASKVHRATQKMAAGIKATQASLKALNAQRIQIGGLEKLNAKLAETRRKMEAATKPAALRRMGAAEDAIKGKIAAVTAALHQQGVDTRNLGTANARLAGQIATTNARLAAQRTHLGQVSRIMGRIDKLRAGFNQAVGRVGLIGGAVGTAAVAALGKSMIDTASKFERFQLILENIEGSSEKAKTSMDWVSEFAQKTPYELDGVMEAFVRLKAYGVDPTDGTLKTLGDTAAAMGKDVMMAVEAIADAMTGENERLKEFGIKASKAGGQITYAWTQNGKQLTRTVDGTNQELIRSTLTAIWNERYGGAMDKLAGSWTGVTSNLSDQWTRFQNLVMQSGPFERLKGHLTSLLARIDAMAKSGELAAWAGQVGQKFVDLIDALQTLARFVTNVGTVFNFLFGWLAQWARNVGVAVAQIHLAIEGGWEGILRYLASIPLRMLGVGAAIIEGLKAGIRSAWAGVVEMVNGMIAWLPDIIKDKLGVKSPSRVFRDIGANLMKGLELGIAGGAGGPLAQLGSMSGRLRQAGAGLALGGMAALSPGLAAAGGGGAAPITIHVHAAPGMDTQALAQEVKRALGRAQQQQADRARARLWDDR